MRIFHLAAIALMSLGLATPAAAALPSPASVANGQAAVRILREAAGALAGEPGLGGMQSLAFDYRGTLAWLNQGRTPADAMTFGYLQQVYFDWQGRQALARLHFEGPESTFQRSVAMVEEPGNGELIEATSLSPQAVVRHLLARPADLTLMSGDGGAATISGPLFGRTIYLAIGRDRRPADLSYFINDDVEGDAVRRFEYRDYEALAGWHVPRRVRQLDAGHVVLDLTLAAFEAGAPRPDWASGLTPAQTAPGEPAAELEIVALAPGIHLLQRHGGDDYHGMLVELEDGLMVLETPAAIGDGSALRSRAASISPKPILYAVPTHHHDDHSAGAAALAAAGATILTTPGNVDFFTRMTRSPRAFSARGETAAARVRALAPGERIGPVQFLDIGSLDHAAEHLIFYFPDHGILFQSDMGRFNPDGSVEPARPHTCALLAEIERRRLRVDRIVGGHGRMGTMEDLRRSAAARDPPCPGARLAG